MNIIRFQGGLGNQMFQFGLYLALQKKYHRRIYLFDIRLSECCHSGFELEKIFFVQKRHLLKPISKFINSWCGRHIERYCFNHFNEKIDYVYDKNIFDTKNFSVYNGYWQSEKYFAECSDIVRKVFTFNNNLLNAKSIQLRDNIKKSTENIYISIHIRRGDYLNINGGINLSLKYYHKALEYIKINVLQPHIVFLVFSDDIQWSIKNLKIQNATYVDWNTDKDCWQDMYLMSICNHNIIANSSFSWWGAWLNVNSDKIVIAPQGGGTDMIPDSWIQI